MRWSNLNNVKKVVVKVGTSTITYDNGMLNINRMEKLVRDISNIKNKGIDVILVTSGAIGAGMGKLGYKERPKTLPEKQALAAIGQGLLIHLYEKLFSEYGQTVAQVLLTKEDLNDRKRYLNIRNTFNTLLNFNVIPIVNENDTVAVDEIKFGENDTLSALVASLLDANILIILSDIDGVYTKDPKKYPDAELIKEIENINSEIEALAGGEGTKRGTGGMVTKIRAARIVTSSGIPMIIANGSYENVITLILEGKDIGTYFRPKENKLEGKKKWIAYHKTIKGSVVVDEGAKKALLEGRSLLPSGILEVVGSFNVGDGIYILGLKKEKIGIGISNYSSYEIEKIMGHKTEEINSILGYKDYDEVIHRDNMVIF